MRPRENSIKIRLNVLTWISDAQTHQPKDGSDDKQKCDESSRKLIDKVGLKVDVEI